MSVANHPAVATVLGSPIRRAFALIEIADDELRAAGNPPISLTDLVAPREMYGLDVAVYRAHARELIGRVGTPAPRDQPTLAELLVAMHQVSLKAPLARHAALLYHHLWKEVFGAELYERMVPEHERPKPEWPGQLQEELAAAQRVRRPR